jgi:hypothetical protein
MGMDTNRRIEPCVLAGERQGAVARPDVPARDEDPLEPGRVRPLEDVVDVRLEAVRVEVAMAVDEWHDSYRGGSSRSSQVLAGPRRHPAAWMGANYQPGS